MRLNACGIHKSEGEPTIEISYEEIEDKRR